MTDWPKTVTYPIEAEDQRVFEIIRNKHPLVARSGVAIIRIALGDYMNRHGPHPEGGGKDADLKVIRNQLEGASTRELMALLLRITEILEAKGVNDTKTQSNQK